MLRHVSAVILAAVVLAGCSEWDETRDGCDEEEGCEDTSDLELPQNANTPAGECFRTVSPAIWDDYNSYLVDVPYRQNIDNRVGGEYGASVRDPEWFFAQDMLSEVIRYQKFDGWTDDQVSDWIRYKTAAMCREQHP